MNAPIGCFANPALFFPRTKRPIKQRVPGEQITVGQVRSEPPAAWGGGGGAADLMEARQLNAVGSAG